MLSDTTLQDKFFVMNTTRAKQKEHYAQRNVEGPEKDLYNTCHFVEKKVDGVHK